MMMHASKRFAAAKGLDQDISDRRWLDQIMRRPVASVSWIAPNNACEHRLHHAHAALTLAKDPIRNDRWPGLAALQPRPRTAGLEQSATRRP